MSAYYDSIHPKADVTHPDVCDAVNSFLHYMVVIKGQSTQSAFNYYIDLKEFYGFLLVFRKVCNEDSVKDFPQNNLELSFIKNTTTEEIYEFLYYLQQTKRCAAATRNRKLSALRGFFKYLTVVTNQLQNDPTTSVDNARKPKQLPKYLSEDECIVLLKNIQSDFYERDYCIITLFLNCGMRLQELVKIDLNDFHDGIILLHGKGNKERPAYLTKACIEAIKPYLIERKKLENIVDRQALFISKRTGKRLTPRRVQQIVERCLESAGLDGKGYSPHKLRHTAATLMYQSGNVDILELQELLGHANVATTQIYTHLDKQKLRDAANSSPLSSLSYIPKHDDADDDDEE